MLGAARQRVIGGAAREAIVARAAIDQVVMGLGRHHNGEVGQAEAGHRTAHHMTVRA
jgi:hypothetical protein